MTTNVLRGRRTGRRALQEVTPEPLSIGDDDSDIFNGPACARPLAAGTRRCPGCNTRLLLGVQARRAAVFAAAGVATGLVAAAVFVAITMTLSQLADPAVVGAAPVPTAAVGTGTTPVATAAPLPTAVPPGAGIPAGALVALERTAEMNARLAAGIPTLRAALAEPKIDTFAVAQVLRSMTADAAFAAGAADRLGAWDDAAGVSAGLVAVYAGIRVTALEGLAKSLASEAAYRTAATRMLEVLAGLRPLDVASRELAVGTGIDLPVVDLSGAADAGVPDAAPNAPAAP